MWRFFTLIYKFTNYLGTHCYAFSIIASPMAFRESPIKPFPWKISSRWYLFFINWITITAHVFIMLSYSIEKVVSKSDKKLISIVHQPGGNRSVIESLSYIVLICNLFLHFSIAIVIILLIFSQICSVVLK